jgi:hypothetical protein
MNKMIGVSLMIGGGVMCALGITSPDLLESHLSRIAPGSRVEHDFWMESGGIVLGLMGLFWNWIPRGRP